MLHGFLDSSEDWSESADVDSQNLAEKRVVAYNLNNDALQALSSSSGRC